VALAIVLGISFILLALSIWVFKRLETSFAKIL
jgi:ABC-type polysaccharide/polyol phosphate export permease